MPTGYTSNIYNNKNVTFDDFVLQCARAFGACIMQRDDSMSDPPKKQEVDTYHLDRYHAAVEKLEVFLKIPKKKKIAELKLEIARKNKEIAANNIKRKKETDALKTRYLEMLQKVIQWTPPTPDHEGLKKFMIEQLNSSIEFDCSYSYTEQLINESPSQYYDTLVSRMKKDITYHEEGYAAEVKCVNSRNKWIDNLYNSLKNT